MAHLQNFELENFKIFAKRFKFDFAPITILTGTNSSGKSCLMKAMSLLENSVAKFPNFEGLSFDYSKSLGTFDDSVNLDNIEVNQYIKFCIPFSLMFDKEFFIDLWFEKNTFGSKKNGKLVNMEIFCDDDSLRTSLFHFSILPQSEISNDLNEKTTLSPNERIYKRSLNILFVIQLLKELAIQQEEESLLREAKRNIENREVDYEWLRPDDSEFDDMMKPFKNGFYMDNEIRNLQLIKGNTYHIDSESISIYLNNNESPLYYYFPVKKEKNPDHPFLEADKKERLSNEQLADLLKIEAQALTQMAVGFEYIIDLFVFDDSHFSGLSKNGILNPPFLEKMIKNLITQTIDMFEKENLQGKEYLIRDVLTSKGEFLINQCIIGPIINGLKRIQNILNINYLGAVRASQQRFITSSSNLSSLNNIIDEFTELDVPSNALVKKFFDYWVKEFDLGEEIVIEGSPSGYIKVPLIKRNGDLINIADLGFGTSQLIPVILNIGLVAFKNCDFEEFNHTYDFDPSIICIEEPESNLHPALQSKLADLFIDAAYKFKIQFIIETHSEYLIRKLQYWTAKKIVAPEATRIFYFNNPKPKRSGENQIKIIEINQDGSLTDDFGTGFYDEAATWKFELLDLKNRGN